MFGHIGENRNLFLFSLFKKRVKEVSNLASEETD